MVFVRNLKFNKKSNISTYKINDSFKVLPKKTILIEKKLSKIKQLNFISRSKVHLYKFLRVSDNKVRELNFSKNIEGEIEKKIFNYNFSILHKKISFFNKFDITVKKIKIQKEIQRKEKDQLNQDQNFNQIFIPAYTYGDFKLFRPLWLIQIEGVQFLKENYGALLADEPGLGKTIQTIVALKILFSTKKVSRALLVVPKSTIGDGKKSARTKIPIQWEGHLELWAPELKYWTINRDDSSRGDWWKSFQRDRTLDYKKEAQIFLVTYDQLRGDIKNKAFPMDYFDLIVLDEIHNIKNPNSQRSMYLKKLEAKYKWGLSGTPVQNAPKDLYAIYEFLKPEQFPSLSATQYEMLTEKEVIKKTKKYILRRLKSKKVLPEKNRKEIWIELDNNQKISYDNKYKIRKDKLRELLSRNTADGNIRKSINGAFMDLLQTCNFDPVTRSSNKINNVVDIIKKIVEKQEKVIVFSRFLDFGIYEILKNLEDSKISGLLLEGSMSTENRNTLLDNFKYNDAHNVLLSTVFTGGVGLNITEATNVIHYDHWWNPAIMWQAEDRVHRIGQKKEVNVFNFFTKNTVEEKVFKLLKNKEKMIKRILGNLDDGDVTETIEKSISTDELLSLFDL